MPLHSLPEWGPPLIRLEFTGFLWKINGGGGRGVVIIGWGVKIKLIADEIWVNDTIWHQHSVGLQNLGSHGSLDTRSHYLKWERVSKLVLCIINMHIQIRLRGIFCFICQGRVRSISAFPRTVDVTPLWLSYSSANCSQKVWSSCIVIVHTHTHCLATACALTERGKPTQSNYPSSTSEPMTTTHRLLWGSKGQSGCFSEASRSPWPLESKRSPPTQPWLTTLNTP